MLYKQATETKPFKIQNKDAGFAIFWFRRDLRLHDNAGLFHALKANSQVLPIFIFDQDILGKLSPVDLRVEFIWRQVQELRAELRMMGSDLSVFFGRPIELFKLLPERLNTLGKFKAIYFNHDYEPQAIMRDQSLREWAESLKINFSGYKDQTIFEKGEILTDLEKPYTVYTPYKNKCLKLLTPFYLKSYDNAGYFQNFIKTKSSESTISLKDLGFLATGTQFPRADLSLKMLKTYAEKRDFPALAATSKLGVHLRFGTVSVRDLARLGQEHSAVWFSELIWRDFFMQILFHFPQVTERSFRPEYERIKWRKSSEDFEKWKNGETGYPLIDAGMRELQQTGYMHNRVRMAVASFLTKHLLIHWLEGERYFSQKLMDYDLAANNGNWQWAAGTGCDAAPYFRIFNPTTQMEKFDPEQAYVRRWVPEFGSARYAKPMIDHVTARQRCLKTYQEGLKGS